MSNTNYNVTLQSNNTDLQAILDAINELPEAESGSSEQVTPEISVSSNGLITATAGTKSSTHQLAFQPAKTITPSTTSQIAVSSGYYTGGDITVAGDSNLVASNIKSGVSIFGVSGTLEEGSGSSGELVDYSENEDAMVDGSLTEYTNDRVTTVGSYAFYNCTSLASVSFPACSYIGNYAFYYCRSLTSVSFPVCTTIGNCAFGNCSRLTNVSFPACTSISSNAFLGCRSLTSVNFPACTNIGYSAFNNCSSLTSVSFLKCTSIAGYAFRSCSSLTSVSFPACTDIIYSAFYSCKSLTSVNFPVCANIGSYAFYSCSSLTSINFPACSYIGDYVFDGCYNLASVKFPACTSIGRCAFQGCLSLSSLTLGASTVCTLSNSNAFNSTPYVGYSAYFSGTPYIYVPSSLVASYQVATNWTYFSSYFSAIEDAE